MTVPEPGVPQQFRKDVPDPADPADPGVRERMAARAGGAITGAVRFLRRPTALLALFPGVLGVLLVVLGALGGSSVRIAAWVFGAIGLLLALRMWVLRRRLLAAAGDPDGLERDLRSAMDMSGHAQRLRTDLPQLATSVRTVSGARSALASLREVSELGGLPTLQPFRPSALRAVGITGALCLFGGVVLTIVTVVLLVITATTSG